jgi:hypothetical protein
LDRDSGLFGFADQFFERHHQRTEGGGLGTELFACGSSFFGVGGCGLRDLTDVGDGSGDLIDPVGLFTAADLQTAKS